MRTITLVSLFSLAAIACDTVDEGKAGILSFSWDSDAQLVPSSFSTKLAKGTQAGVNVFSDDKGLDATSVVNAESADPSVAEIVSTAGNLIMLEGRGAGTTTITVESVAGTDSFDVTVAEIDLIDLDYPGAIAPDSPKSVGIQGGTARFLMRLKDASGNVLIGTGEAVEAGITVNPSSGAQLGDEQALGSLSLVFSNTGSIEITGKKDTALQMDVVADADVTALEWRGLEGSLIVGQSTVGILRGVTQSGDQSNTVVGVASLATVTSSNTAVCTAELNPKLGEGVYLVSAKATGECLVTASLGARSDIASLQVVAP